MLNQLRNCTSALGEERDENALLMMGEESAPRCHRPQTIDHNDKVVMARRNCAVR